MDSDLATAGPKYRNYTFISFYFISFILVGSFILINLFTGVICYYFENASKNEKRRGNIILTTEQENWIEIQRMTVEVKVGLVKERPQNYIRAKFYDLVESGYFDALIMMCILLNIATMAMVFEESSPEYNAILESINTGFTSVFIAETTFKIIAYGFIDFMQSGWNQFDLFVVITSLLDIALSQVGTNASFLRVGPQLIRIVRVLRVTRLLKLVKSMRGLQKLLQSLYYSLPALMNIGALLFLCFFIFSILAVFLFSGTPLVDQLNVFNNFDNFGLSLLTLYRCSTGENWEWIMYDVYVQQRKYL
jgi:Ion transport protein